MSTYSQTTTRNDKWTCWLAIFFVFVIIISCALLLNDYYARGYNKGYFDGVTEGVPDGVASSCVYQYAKRGQLPYDVNVSVPFNDDLTIKEER